MKAQVSVDGLTWPVDIEIDEDGVFVVTCPLLRGCISDGKTKTEALENFQEALALYLESLRAHGDPIPTPTTS